MNTSCVMYGPTTSLRIPDKVVDVDVPRETDAQFQMYKFSAYCIHKFKQELVSLAIRQILCMILKNV